MMASNAELVMRCSLATSKIDPIAMCKATQDDGHLTVTVSGQLHLALDLCHALHEEFIGYRSLQIIWVSP